MSEQKPGSENNWDRVEGYLGHDALTQLGQKKVAIIGLGSGGGFAAVSLAMSGVGRFVLIDDDKIEAGNIVRHVADLRYVGIPKAEAITDLIRLRNPQAQIETVHGRLEDHTKKLHGVDLIVVGVDGERSKYLINDFCREHSLPAVYAGVYEKGEGGDVFIYRPTESSPCYACWAEQLRSDISLNPDTAELDYGMIGPDGTLAAEPSLWIHVVRIASVQSELALNEMLVGQPIHRIYPANTVILANVAMEIVEGITTQPYSSVWVDIARNPECMVCGKSRKAGTLANKLSSELTLDELLTLQNQPQNQQQEKNTNVE